MAQRHDASFWISYSDLATGLMIVFMLVMLLLMAVGNQQRAEAKRQIDEQQQRIQELLESVQIILGTRARLADALQEGLHDRKDVTVDAVTAQLVLDSDLLSFEPGSAEITDRGRRFLDAFARSYSCALWSYETKGDTESAPSPNEPSGVRRILVTGRADLDRGASGNVDNQALSGQRALAVVDRLLLALGDTDGGGGAVCAGRWSEVQDYMRARLRPIGAGDREHCIKEFGGIDCGAHSQSDPDYRNVTFSLDVTGDDMTGLLLDVVELSKTVDDAAEAADSTTRTESEDLRNLKDQLGLVVDACREDEERYHGCQKILKECGTSGGSVCEGAPQSAQAPVEGGVL
ncbi:MAG TPA: hypothetical protein ENK18_28215 [Deltaproteobacteria bacterium]|nr:hypothetical protein [Deltaproteobacteria bacterium]